jgi:hypothetical protein
MMMKMLQAGGMEILTDSIRKTDENNPKGYFEYEPVKGIVKDHTFLDSADGKAVKIISWLVKYLPDEYSYQVIFMSRNIDEIISSQKKMLERDGKSSDKQNPQKLSGIYIRHVNEVADWMSAQKNMALLYMNYNVILKEPLKNTKKIARFIDGGGGLDAERMASVIDIALYRQRIELSDNKT